jgi:MFS family permease
VIDVSQSLVETGPVTLLRAHRDFRRLWAAQAASQVGTMVTGVAVPLLAVTALHAGPFQVGLLTACQYLAFLLIGLPAGAWVDRMRHRRVMIVADLGRVVALGSVPVAAAAGALTLWQLYAAVLVTGGLTVFFDVAYQSYLPFLVGRDGLVSGNATLQGTQSVAQVAGPGLGGLLVQALTAPYAIVVDAASYLWSAAWLGTIRRVEPRPERAPHAALLPEIREGVAFIVRQPLLRAIAGCTASANLFAAGGQSLVLVLLARDLRLSAGAIGALLSAGAVGGVLGALGARRFADRVGQGPAMWLAMGVTAPFLVVEPFLQRGPVLALFVLAEALFGAGAVAYNVLQVSFRQALCPDRLRGRMNATMRFLVWGTLPLGGVLGGALGAAAGVRPALLVVTAGGSLPFLWLLASPLRHLRELPVDADLEPVAGA